MRAIHLINFPTDQVFGAELENELRALGSSEIYRYYSNGCLIDLGNGMELKPRVISNGLSFEMNNTFVFFKRRNPGSYLSTLLANFVVSSGGICMNSAYLLHQRNIEKQYQALNLAFNEIRIPRTLIFNGKNISLHRSYIEKELSYPMVLKTRGSGGKAVWKISNYEEIQEHLSAQTNKSLDGVILQEYIENSFEEFRVIFFLGEVLTVIRRSSESFYNNVAQGGVVSRAEINDFELKLCTKVAKISGLDYMGVDFMKDDEGGLVFTEIQTGPALNVSKKTNESIVVSMAETIKEKFL